jgi:two-component system response regulator AtoC
VEKSILIADDEPLIASSLASVLKSEGFDVQVAQNGRQALASAAVTPPDVALVDLVLGDMDGLDVLRKLRGNNAGLPVILLTAHGSIDSAVAAMKAGAYDFIKKPFELDEVIAAVRNALRTQELESRVRYLEGEERRGTSTALGESPAARRLKEELQTIARSPVPVVLLLGESGTGKSVAARLLHDHSDRASGQFVEINCAAIPETLLEAELFGHERGAFSDAVQRREGLVEVADHGTLFLDEIGDLPLSLQAKLLKFVEERRFRRLGSNRVRSVDTRIVAATNQHLRSRVDDGRFRADLYFRLSEITVQLPPLSQRGEDIILLANHFLTEASRRYRKAFKGVTPEAKAVLQAYRWPGNVRELRAVINRIALMNDGEWITAMHLPPEIAASGVLEEPQLPTRVEGGPIPTLEDVELAYIRRVLTLCGGNKLLAAKYLGIARQTLARRLNEAA